MDNTTVAKNSLSVGQMEGKIKRFEIVELGGNAGIATGTTGRVSFTDQPQLRNQPGQIIIITNVEVFLDTVYGHSQYTNSLVGFPAADLKKCVLVLYVGGEESIHYIPLAKLNHIDDKTNSFQWDLQGFDRLSDLDWDKSYVQYNAASAAGSYIIPFGVTYFRFKFDPASQTFVEK
jgi:hypothetical protein